MMKNVQRAPVFLLAFSCACAQSPPGDEEDTGIFGATMEPQASDPGDPEGPTCSDFVACWEDNCVEKFVASQGPAIDNGPLLAYRECMESCQADIIYCRDYPDACDYDADLWIGAAEECSGYGDGEWGECEALHQECVFG